MGDFIDDTLNTVFAVLEQQHGDIDALSHEMRIVLLVHSAQGVIDNGGLQYFFESNWEGNPSYEVFITAYRELGASREALLLKEAVALLAIPSPHLDADRRIARLQELWDDPDGRFGDLDHELCGNEAVWDCLRTSIKRNTRVFKGLKG